MIEIAELSEFSTIAYMLLCCWYTVLIWSNGMLMALSVRKNAKPQRWLRILVFIILFMANFIALQCSTALLHHQIGSDGLTRLVEWYGHIPAVLILVFCFVSTSADLYLLFRMAEWKKKHICSASIKEAVDNMPVGICAYTGDGSIILKNRVMEKLCREMTGEALLTGTEFQKVIWSGRTLNRINNTSSESTCIIRLSEEKAWSFFKEPIHTGSLNCVMLTATDVSEEYQKTQALWEKQNTVRILNKRLSAYNHEIVSVISEKEILSAKIRIHDELGGDLLAIKRFLVTGGDKQKRVEILKLAERNIDFFLEETKEEEHSEYKLILSTAKDLGVTVRVTGILPDKQPYQHVIATAIHECLTNTLRHAGGNLLNVCVQITEEGIEVHFTNNGRKPKGEILEKCGLTDLRILTEECGGKMTVKAEPHFLLTILLPKEEDNCAI